MKATASAAGQRKRASRLSPEERKLHILQTATRRISESGFNGVSVADIAQACGIGKSLVLHYFPSMKALLTAVLEAHGKLDFIQTSGGLMPEASPEAVRAFVTRHIESNLHHKEMIRLHRVLDIEALDPAHAAHLFFTERHRRTLDATRRILSWKPNPEQAANELLAFWHGLEIEWLRDDELDVMSVWNSFADSFFAMPQQ